MVRYGLFLVMCLLVGCGKVSEDISSQSNRSVFKMASFSFSFSSNDVTEWADLVSTKNTSVLYSYFEGLKLDREFEKIGWVEAEIKTQRIASKNVPVVSNYDMKKNIVTTSRYQQGVISVQEVSTGNYRTLTEFRKVRPTFDYYSFVQYKSKDAYLFFISEDVSTASVTITPYKHLISAVFLNHLKKESYNRETVIPLSMFYSIIPTASITPTLNIMPKNKVKSFQTIQPFFLLDSPLFDSLLTTVSLSYYSDESDVLDYINSTDKMVFSDGMKTHLKKSVGGYFSSKKRETPSENIVEKKDD